MKNLFFTDVLNLIPSESFVSEIILKKIQETDIIRFNKYIEGQIGKRYYRGAKKTDLILLQCKDALTRMTGFKFHNLQALSGAIANLAIIRALFKKNDVILRMSLGDGGHLSHGFRSSITNEYAHFVDYKISVDGKIDYDYMSEFKNSINIWFRSHYNC